MLSPVTSTQSSALIGSLPFFTCKIVLCDECLITCMRSFHDSGRQVLQVLEQETCASAAENDYIAPSKIALHSGNVGRVKDLSLARFGAAVCTFRERMHKGICESIVVAIRAGKTLAVIINEVLEGPGEIVARRTNYRALRLLFLRARGAEDERGREFPLIKVCAPLGHGMFAFLLSVVGRIELSVDAADCTRLKELQIAPELA